MLLIMIHLYSASSIGICPTTFCRNFAEILQVPPIWEFLENNTTPQHQELRYLRLREVRGLNIVLFKFVLEEPMGEDIMI